jgi:hypothetical protein
MDFKKVLKFLLLEFSNQKIDFALVGGLAVSVYTDPRMTQDIDLIVMTLDFDKAKKILIDAGYKLEYESSDIATFISAFPDMGRIDIQLAHRKHAIDMIKRAKEVEVLSTVKIKILKPEDLIGLKVQAYNNDPSRYYKDMADIQELLKNEDCKDLPLIEEYFKIFDRLDDFKKLIKELGYEKKKQK